MQEGRGTPAGDLIMPTHYTHHGPVEALAPEQGYDRMNTAPMTLEDRLAFHEPSREEWIAILEAASEMDQGRAGTRGGTGRRNGSGPVGKVRQRLYGTESTLSRRQRKRLDELSRLLIRVARPLDRRKVCEREGCEVRFVPPPNGNRRYCSPRCKTKVAESKRETGG